jgi:hypothetical protein
MTDNNWDYGGAYKAIDMTGEIALPNGSIVEVCDWTERLPEFMRLADTLFVDPPWNGGNVRSFYTKADLDCGPVDFAAFSASLWQRIGEIAPATLFVEMGKENLGRYLEQANVRYKYVTFYNSTYYGKRENKCYVIHATHDRRTRRHKDLEDMDEARIIEWVCANHPYEVIGDLCMGRGLVGRHAYQNGRRFVGTELNHKRLAVLVDFVREAEKAKLAAA